MPDNVDARGLEAAFEGLAHDEAMDMANRWFSAATEHLYEGGDELDYDVQNVAQSGVPPQDEGDEIVFKFIHPASRFFNDGTDDHPVVGNDTLAFEWPEVANEEFGDTGKTFKEVYADTWPTVFMPAVNVSGIEAIKFMEKGRARARAGMR